MDKEEYLTALGKKTALSAGLAAYINYVLIAEQFSAKQVLRLDQIRINPTTMILKGSARLYLETEYREEHTLLFYQHHDFLSIGPEMRLHPESALFIEFLEDSELCLVPDNHLANLYKLFPEFPQVQSGHDQTFKQILFNHHISLSVLSGFQRYSRFLSEYKQIAMVCEQKKIASFLGMDPKTLSRLRGKPNRK
ncbi:MAG: Crp/Fnr family transcriptional regulator [Pedobacter sp.]|nr:MAG: Crp/Fnr family transcriptional regulator [Pedobacter sp.]